MEEYNKLIIKQEFVHSVGQLLKLDMTKLVFALCNSANARKNTLRGLNVGSLSTKAGGKHRKQSALRTQRLILKIMQLYYVSCTIHIVIRIRILIVLCL